MSMATRKRGRPKKAESQSSQSELPKEVAAPTKPPEPIVEHVRIRCISCDSTDIERVCESRQPLKLALYTVRWYRRRCRACHQTFVTKEKDYK